MTNWREVLIPRNTTIREAIHAIDRGCLQVALVVDQHQRLEGIVTDGDVRRGLLNGVSLDSPVNQIMNLSPITAAAEDRVERIVTMMKVKQLRHIPIVDDQGVVLGLQVLDQLVHPAPKDNWVILMAGGLGSRLAPLTNDCPKPLLNVGGRPILETIVESFVEHGFRRIFIAVNYMAEMIENHFGNGEAWGAEIYFLREKEKLGTAGALSLLPERPEKPFLVMNGDILTKVNFQQLLDFHEEHHAEATTCVRDYHFQVPFGVVKQQNGRLIDIQEKPSQHVLVNAGIYVLNPGVLDHIPRNRPLDMPDLLKQCMANQGPVCAFPIREYWMDIGKMDDFIRANSDFQEIFV